MEVMGSSIRRRRLCHLFSDTNTGHLLQHGALQMIAEPDSAVWLQCGRAKSPDVLARFWAV